jgi:type VI secretion system secreted protein VgrG
MSELFTVSLKLRSPKHNLDLESFVGRAARVRVGLGERAASRVWSGVCSRFEQTHAEVNPSDAGLSTYAMQLVPAAWLMTQRRDYRVSST